MSSFHIAYFIIMLAVLLAGMMRFRRLNGSSKLMLLLLAVTMISESAATYLMHATRQNNYVYHIFQPIELSLVAYAFWQEIRNRLIILVIPVNLVFSIINSLIFQPYDTVFNSNAFVFESFCTLVITLWYLKRLLSEPTPYNFTSYPLFWISAGFAIFNLINLFILGTHNTIADVYPKINAVFYYVRFFSNYLLYALFLTAFLCPQRQLDATK